MVITFWIISVVDPKKKIKPGRGYLSRGFLCTQLAKRNYISYWLSVIYIYNKNQNNIRLCSKILYFNQNRSMYLSSKIEALSFAVTSAARLIGLALHFKSDFTKHTFGLLYSFLIKRKYLSSISFALYLSVTNASSATWHPSKARVIAQSETTHIGPSCPGGFLSIANHNTSTDNFPKHSKHTF